MRRFLSLFTMLMLCGVLAFAQSRVVTGKITDKEGNPVPFASVKVKGTQTGVSADANGAFSLKVKNTDVLELSGAGFKVVEVPVGTQTVLSTTLEKNDKLTEVIVTGFAGTKKTSRSTSVNAQVVGQEQLNPVRSTNINNALAGKVSGIQVRSQSGVATGRATNIRLRGESAFGGGAGVLYVVDGTIMPNSNDINLDDVDNVTVLQGPAAAAKFGAEGANGAIIITLKKAKKNQKGMGIEINSGVKFDNVYIMPNYQDTYAGGDGANMTKYNWQPGHPEGWKALDGKYFPDYSEDVSWGPKMAGQEYIPWYAWYGGHERSFTTAKLTPQPNNAREFFATGIQTNNNVNFSKATDNYSFRASYSNLDVRGLLPNTGMNKNNFNVNTSLNLTEKLTVSTNVNYITNNLKGEIDDSYANATSGSFNQWFHRDLDMSIVKELRGLKTPTGIWASWNHQNPNTYDVNNQKNFYGAYYWYNPYTYSDLSPIITRNDRLFGNIGLSYKLSPSITINGTYRKQQNTTFTEQKYSSQLFESGVKTAGGNCPQCFGQYVTQNTFSNRDNFQGSLVYSKKIKNFQVDGDVGFDVFHQVTKSNGGFTNNGLNVPDLFTLTNSKTNATFINNRTDEKRRALYASATLGYKNFLFVDGTIRNDWYSTLPVTKNDVLSKSYGASFVFSDLIKVPFITYGKIRGSVGEVPQGIDPYQYPGFAYPVGANQWNGNFLMGTPDQIVDPKIRGAVNSQRELGLEMKFAKNRVGFSVTYWDGTSKDFPTAVPITGTSGFTSRLLNIGEIKKTGVDVQFNVIPLKSKNFTWEINATWGKILKNTVVDLDGDPTTTSRQVVENQWGSGAPGLVHEEGKQWGQIWGNGIKRINGQPVLDGSGFYVTDPNVSYGSVLPSYTGGVQNRIDLFKYFTLNVSLDYQWGGKFFSLSDMWGSYTGLTARTATLNDKGNPIRDAVADGGGKHVFGVDATGKAVDYYVEARDYYSNLYGNKAYDEFVYDLTFVKLREVGLGYNIPVEKLGIGKWITKANFSVVANNPLLIYAKTKDLDPSEISAISGEGGNYPSTRSLGFNLKIGF